MNKKNIVIVGGGLPGLFTALYLSSKKNKANIYIIERNYNLGGLFGSIEHPEAGIFDHGMHVFYETSFPEINRLIQNCLDEKDWLFLEGNQKDIAGVFYNKKLNTNSPYISLDDVPNKYFKECALDLFLSLENTTLNADAFENAFLYFNNRFGESLTRYVFEPIMKKLWNKELVDLSPMATKIVLMDRINYFSNESTLNLMKSNLIRDRIGLPDQLLLPLKYKSSQRGLYPKKFGINNLVNKIREKLISNNVKILCSSEINDIMTIDGNIKSIEVLSDSKNIIIENIKSLIWTIPTFPLAKIFNLKLNEFEELDPPIKQKSIYFLLRNYPNMEKLYYFYCFDKGFKTFRVTNYSAYCKSAVRSKNSRYPNTYPLCVEAHLHEKIENENEVLEHIIIKELIDFKVIKSSEDVVFSFQGKAGGGFPTLSNKNIFIIKKFKDLIKNLNLKNLIVSGQEPENGIFFLNQVLENLYYDIKNY